MTPMSVAAYEQNDVSTLENAWVRAQIDRKSGWLSSLFDKRTQQEVLDGGMWVELFGEKAPGYFANSILRREEGEAAILLTGIEWSSRVGWSLECKLREDSCALYVALTLFCRDDFRELDVGLRTDVENCAPVVMIQDKTSAFSPFVKSHIRIYPFQTIRIRGSLLPTALAPNPSVGDGDAALVKSVGEMQIAFAREFSGCRIEMKLRDGGVVSATTNASPTRPVRIGDDQVSGILESLRVLNVEGEVVAEFNKPSEVNSHAQIAESWLDRGPGDGANWTDDEIEWIEGRASWTRLFQGSDHGHLLRSALSPSFAPIAYLALGFSRMKEQKWAEAATFVNESLIHNSANPIAWWAKHVCLKKLGEVDPEPLTNAHYVAPHEPLLKAEAFLQLPDSDSKLLDSYNGDPQPFLEVAEFFIQAGLYEELYLWLSEGLKRTDDPLISLMLAWLHKKAGQDVEAEMFVERARKSAKPIRPIRAGELAAAEAFAFPVPPL